MIERRENFGWYFDNEVTYQGGPNKTSDYQFAGEDYATLIRESIQNSLDAVLDMSKPVKVEIRIRRLIKQSDFQPFFELKEHIQGCIDMYGAKAKSYEPMLEYFGDDKKTKLGYIIVSDSNTTGMRYVEGDTNCEFYAFAFSEGVSNKKSENTGGAFGFGKTAYFKLSPIQTIILSTRFHKDNKPAFIGISRLCTHKFRGATKTSVGYYVHQPKEGKVVPVTNDSEIPDRFKHEEPGTSISIIGIKYDEDSRKKAKEEMIEAVLRYYWLAIWENKLVVDIDGEEVNKNNLEQLIEKTFSEEIDNKTWKTKCNPRPYFDAVRFEGNKEKGCEVIHAVLPDIQEVDLYIKKNKEASDKVIYMRRNLMYIQPKSMRTHYGYNALFVCRGVRGDRILKELENPSHNEWDNKYRITKLNLERGTSNYKLGEEVLGAIDRFISEQTEKLFYTNQIDSIDIAGLEDYLYIPEDLSSDGITSRAEYETLQGNPTGDYVEDGTRPITMTEKPPEKEEKKEKNVGHVIVAKIGSTKSNSKSDRRVGSGNLHTGHGSKPVNPAASHNFTGADVKETEEGTFLEYIPVTYKVVAQQQNGKMYHAIIFHSPIATGRGEIELVVGGEQTNEVLQILETNAGVIRDNFISNLHVVEGKNIIKLRFNDNLKHVVILKAYESKR